VLRFKEDGMVVKGPSTRGTSRREEARGAKEEEQRMSDVRKRERAGEERDKGSVKIKRGRTRRN